MYEFYRHKHSASLLQKIRKEIKQLYNQIPETEGCIANHASCQAWCCQLQNPQVMLSEFLLTWNRVQSNWAKEKIVALIKRCMINYVNPSVTKPCVFWDSETKHCLQHDTRPFNCRLYGQVPEEEFKPRYERLKVLYEKDSTVDIRPQCSLVKTVGEPPSMAESDAWFKSLKEIEAELVSPYYIHFEEGGSYRTYHDHILLTVCSNKVVKEMTQLRLSGTPEQKAEFIERMTKKMMEEKHVATEDGSKGN